MGVKGSVPGAVPGAAAGAGAVAGAGAEGVHLPLLSATSAAITTACGARGLKDSAFVSLLELLSDKK